MPKISTPCEYCGKAIVHWPSRPRRFCSKSCLGRYGIESGISRKPKTGVEHPCDVCGTVIWRMQFQIKEDTGRCCSKECRDQAQRVGRVDLVCERCGKASTRRASEVERGVGRFCGRECYSLAAVRNHAGREHNGKPAVIDTHGYIRIYEPDHPKSTPSGWVLEHRVVVEAAIGRYLTRDEHVHHLNHDRTDNRLENLEVLNPHEHAQLTGRENGEVIKAAIATRAQLARYIEKFGPMD